MFDCHSLLFMSQTGHYEIELVPCRITELVSALEFLSIGGLLDYDSMLGLQPAAAS